MTKSIPFIFVILFLSSGLKANNFQVESPDNNIKVNIVLEEALFYSVHFQQNQVIKPSSISFTFKNMPPLGNDLDLIDQKEYSFDEKWTPVLKRFTEIRNHYNALEIQLQEKRFPKRRINVEFRVYNEGVAFRTILPEQFPGRKNTLTNEFSTFNFAKDFTCWSADYGSYDTHQETEFWKRKISEITEKMYTGVPFTFKVSENCYGAITEADLTDYAGMYLKPRQESGEFALSTDLAPLHNQPDNGDRVNFEFLLKTPWRVIMLADKPGDLVESEIIQNLNDPCEIEDPSWIQPGISAWDHWWSGEVKMEQEVIYQYIDLASKMGWPFMLIDWQWYGQFDLPEADITKPASQLNMPAIFDYAKNKNVRCWLWLYWTDVDKADWESACAIYEKWGVAGVKIDFMARDDQEMVNWYHRIVKTAAKHKLMVDFHGAYKPTGWRRTYPNLMTREGVLGNEYNKWSIRITPEHICTLPFTRMLAGPMDFTPGGFLNRMPDKFRNGTPAHVLGTRANTLAQFVIFDSPYLVACDHPVNYENEVGVEFLKQVKSVWDDTKVLNGEIGEYISMARRDNKNWFLGAITNSVEREIEIDLKFLPDGKFKMTSYSDTNHTPENAELVEKAEFVVSNEDLIKVKMFPGGGFAAVLEPQK